MQKVLTILGVALSFASAGCARSVRPPAPPPVATPAPSRPPAPPATSRTAAEIEAGLARSKTAKPFLPLLSDEEAHKALPTMFRGRPMPNLLLVAGLQPRTMEAVMAVSKQVHTEGDLDPQLLNDVFWAVSSSNECFY